MYEIKNWKVFFTKKGVLSGISSYCFSESINKDHNHNMQLHVPGQLKLSGQDDFFDFDDMHCLLWNPFFHCEGILLLYSHKSS